MTDLENLWDDYPTGPAPVTAVLAATASKRRIRGRFMLRPVATAGAVTALAGAFVAGTLVNGSGGPGAHRPGPVDQLPRHVAFQADLAPAKSCDELLQSYVARALEIVGPWGWGSDRIVYDASAPAPPLEGDMASGLTAQQGYRNSAEAPTAAMKSPKTERQVNSETGTNVQEAGVDEPDTVKTDGKVLVVERHGRLDVYDVTGSSTQRVSYLPLPSGIEDPEILLAGDTVVVVGNDATDAHDEGTRVATVSVADPATPKIVDQVRYSAGTVSVRQHGDTVRLVLANALPDLDFVQPNRARTEKEAREHNRQAVRDSTIADWLPTVTVGDGKARQLLDCNNVAVPTQDLALGTSSVVGFNATTPDKLDAIGLAGLTDIAYESADHLYLASGGSQAWHCIEVCATGSPTATRRRFFPGQGSGGSSYLFDFALKGPQATHVASGEVEGAIRDRWSLDEAGGVLRVAVGPTSETGNFSSVLTLEQQGTNLVERGRLDGLGRNEEIQSVRWFDDLAIVVTFRQTDPLYAVDLSDTTAPKLLSELKIPGFSAYLHPMGRARMIGIGEGPQGPNGRDWGAQIGLFDVRDTTAVKRLDVLGYGTNTQALAGGDPRSFTWLPEHRTVLTVVEKWSSRRIGYLSVVKLHGGKLHERRVKVEYGDDVDRVRTVPMPDGRVVLVTGDQAQFFEL